MNKKVTKILNILIGLISFGAWLYMVLRGNQGEMLTAGSFSSLKFFTVLSNLFNGAVCLMYAYILHKGNKPEKWFGLLKLCATTGVTLTFLTVVVFLGPVYGYTSMFRHANFWMHLVLPLASIYSFVFREEHDSFHLKDSTFSLLFPAVYEVGYVGNILINGKGEWPESNDFYGFLNWGIGIGALIAVLILIVTWVISIGLITGRKRYQSVIF